MARTKTTAREQEKCSKSKLPTVILPIQKKNGARGTLVDKSSTLLNSVPTEIEIKGLPGDETSTPSLDSVPTEIEIKGLPGDETSTPSLDGVPTEIDINGFQG